MRPKIDPRQGDIEDDASSSKRRSLLSLAGSLLAEISLPKLAVAWMLLIVFPGLMLGIAPIVASIWFGRLSDRFASSLAGVWSAILLVALVALGWFGGRRVFRLAERSFWSLNSLAVQPLYTASRETIRHLLAHRLAPDATATQRSRLHATTAVMSGVVICGIALLALMLAWPSSHLSSDIAILSSPKRLAMVALANSVVLVSAYVAAAALVWAVADATMDPPHDLEAFDTRPDAGAHVAHRTSVGYSRRRRALRLPNRERQGGAARQRAAEAGPCGVGDAPCQ